MSIESFLFFCDGWTDRYCSKYRADQISSKNVASVMFQNTVEIIIRQNNTLMAANQSGFQAGKSCNTAVLKVMEDIRRAFESGDLLVMVLIDFSKAFDSIYFKLLINILKNFFWIWPTSMQTSEFVSS